MSVPVDGGLSSLQRQGASVPAALIDRLSAATAGSRELDYAVTTAASPTVGRHPQWEPPHVTTSLDAALTLAERVLGDRARVWEIDRIFGRHSVQFGDYLTTPPGEGATAALAACAAILKARTAVEADSVGISRQRNEPSPQPTTGDE